MYAAGAHFAAVAGVIDVLREEHGVVVPRAERLELLEYAGEFGGNLREVEPGVQFHYGSEFLPGDIAGDEAVHALAELLQVLFLHGEAGGIDVSAEVLQQVGTTLDGRIQVETLHAAGAAGHETVALGEYHRGFVIGLYQAGRHDAHHALVPGGVVYDGDVLRLQGRSFGHHLQSLLGDFPVDGLALVVGVVYGFAQAEGHFVVGGGEQFHGHAAALHAPGRVDARANLKDNVVDGDVPGLQLGQVDHGQQALSRILVQALEAIVGQDAVLAGHGHQV